MAMYRKKPVVIEAVQWLNCKVDCSPAWFIEAQEQGVIKPHGDNQLSIKTLEGTMVVMPGDWIIRGVKNEIYPCKPDIFEATYEAV